VVSSAAPSLVPYRKWGTNGTTKATVYDPTPTGTSTPASLGVMKRQPKTTPCVQIIKSALVEKVAIRFTFGRWMVGGMKNALLRLLKRWHLSQLIFYCFSAERWATPPKWQSSTPSPPESKIIGRARAWWRRRHISPMAWTCFDEMLHGISRS